ncbi:DUF3311 domain-containing protein [Gemmatimonas sp.]
MSRPYRLLALVPVLAIVGAPWWANRVEPRVFGLPFLLAWISGWVLATSAVMLLVSVLDAREDRADDPPMTEPGRERE